MRRLLLVALIVAGCSTAARSDADLKAVMAGNIGDFGTIADGIARNRDGSLDIAVRDRVVIVAASAIARTAASAAALCRSVAAVTNDPDTAKPLGIIGVVVVSGSNKLAECRP